MTLGRIDRYELLQLIGQGSFGGVYRARHVHTGQLHALKLARDGVDPEGAARVLAEARAAASLRHPNVVGVIDGGVAPTGEAFIVMELLEGRTLADLVAREGPLPPARVARISTQMLDALGAAHASGIVHRDVKPSNVFVVRDGHGNDLVKVIDFGISKVQRSLPDPGLTLPGMAMGTPGYMAPEQLGDARSVDPRADLYAVGATMFEMLTKRRPIEADSFEGWARKLVTERAPPLAQVAPHVPLALANVVDRALARDVDARWPHAAAMRAALLQALTMPHVGDAPTELGTPPGLSHDVGRHGPLSGTTTPGMRAPTLHGASGSSASLLPWLVGAGILVLFVVAGVSSSIYWYVSRAAQEATAAAAAPPPTVTVTVTVPAPPAPAAPPASTVPAAGPRPAPQPTPGPAAPGTVRIAVPKIIGELRQDAFMALAARARPAIERCNADHRSVSVKVDVMIGQQRITIAQPSVNTNPGDPAIARCVAQSLKDAQSTAFTPGESGIYQEAQFTWP